MLIFSPDTLDAMWKLRYDDVWGGLFLRATGDPEVYWGVDYGFPYYNDHHFHLGYFIYAAAYYVKYHQSWGRSKTLLFFLYFVCYNTMSWPKIF